MIIYHQDVYMLNIYTCSTSIHLPDIDMFNIYISSIYIYIHVQDKNMLNIYTCRTYTHAHHIYNSLYTVQILTKKLYRS